MSKVIRVKRVCDITVYPTFCKMASDLEYLLQATTGICEEDDGTIAFLDEEAKSKCLKKLYNLKNSRKRISAEEYKRRQREIQKRRCLK